MFFALEIFPFLLSNVRKSLFFDDIVIQAVYHDEMSLKCPKIGLPASFYHSETFNQFLNFFQCFGTLLRPSLVVKGKCRIFRNVTSNSIKPWYHCPRDGGRAEIHKIFITPKLIKGRFNFGGGGVLLQSICLAL